MGIKVAFVQVGGFFVQRGLLPKVKGFIFSNKKPKALRMLPYLGGLLLATSKQATGCLTKPQRAENDLDSSVPGVTAPSC